MDVASLFDEKQWKCFKHTSQLFHGVCPGCLFDRLIVLCPDCANLRPCGCLPSSSSLSFIDPPISTVGSRIGDVSHVGNLIDGEPAVRRSRSAAFQFIMSRSSIGGEHDGAESEKVGGRRRHRRSLFWFLGNLREEEAAAPEKMRRSRSVVERKILGWGKGWNWHFSSPNIRFSRRKAEKVLVDRSASRREGSGSF